MKKYLLASFCALAGILFLGSNASASVRMEWGQEDTSYSGDVGYNRTISGAAWYYYSIPSNYNGPQEVQLPFNDTFRTKISVPVSNCKDYGGVYVLLRNEYNKSDNSLTGKPAAPTAISDIQTGSWMGAYNAVQYRQPQASVNDANNILGIRATKTVTWNEAYGYFQSIKDTGAVQKDSNGQPYGWNTRSGLTYFCYGSNNNISYTGSFHSYSSVAMGEDYESTPVPDGTSYLSRSLTVPKGSTIKLTFHHYIARKEQDSIGLPIKWTVKQGQETVGSGTTSAKDLSGTSLDNLSAKEIFTGTFETTISSSNGYRQTFCQTIEYEPKNYRISNKGEYESLNGKGSSTACVTIVPSENDYIKSGVVQTSQGSYNFNCNSGGGLNFISNTLVGNTTATVGLLKNNSEFKQTTSGISNANISYYAKPGDTFQFFYALCFGAHNVLAKNGRAFTGTNAKNTGNTNNYIQNTFMVYNGTRYNKENNEDFLFGRASFFMGQEITVRNAHARRSSGLKLSSTKGSSSFLDSNLESIVSGFSNYSDYYFLRDQQLRFASPDTAPKNAGTIGGGTYDCFFYSGIDSFAKNNYGSGGYQIPGFQSFPSEYLPENCNSANLQRGTNGRGRLVSSVVGGTVNQTLQYNALAVWREYLSSWTGSCGCNNSSGYYSQVGPLTTYSTNNIDGGSAPGAYYERNLSTASNFISRAANAYYSGLTIGGRYRVPIGSSKVYVAGNYSANRCTYSTTCNCYCYYIGETKYCYTCRKYTTVENFGSKGTLKKAEMVYTDETVSKTASVIVPYNYDTALTANIIDNGKDILYAGEPVTSEFNVDITPIANPLTSDKDSNGNLIPYATITPDNTEVQVAEFLVRDTADLNSIASSLKDTYYGNTVNSGANNASNKLCEYFYSLGNAVADCHDEIVKGANLKTCDNGYCEGPAVGNNNSNPEGEQGYYTAGKAANGASQYTKLVPDVAAGYKYCTAVGINYGNSHGGYNGNPFKTLSSNSSDPNFGANSRSVNDSLSTTVIGYYWHISAASCRTIAKKPTMQVWNGGLFSTGGINTSTTAKYATAQLGDLEKYNSAVASALQKEKYVFGSWEEYYIVSNGTVNGFASASALGYNGNNLNTRGSINVNTNSFTSCDFARLTIANTLNTSCSSLASNTSLSNLGGNYTGSNSGSALTDDSRVANFVSQILARYTKTSLSRVTQPNTVDASNDSFYENLSNSATGNSRYLYVDGDLQINSTIVQGSGTRVIHVNGHVSINRNICLGTGGVCQSADGDDYKNGYSPLTNNLSLARRNTDNTYSDISQIPQVIIVANSIGIGSDVTQVDAWLITADQDDISYGGYVNTCDVFQDGRTGTDQCWKTLKINGPVVTRALLMNRTGGSWAGLSGDIGNPAYEYLTGAYAKYNSSSSKYFQGGPSLGSGSASTRDLSCDGSMTPAEIFDLHPLVYLWSYYQAQRFTQAITTYSSEYAPRF